MLRVTADSNIYISALAFGGTPDSILDLAREGAIRLTISDHILAEVGRVLGKKFGWPEDALELAKESIGNFTEKVTTLERIRFISTDPTDNRILECAIDGRSDYLVTGDKHLLELGSFCGIPIVKASDFFNRAWVDFT